MWATTAEQAANRRMFSNNTTGFAGIIKTKSGRFKARYDTGRKRFAIAGSFATAKEAAVAREKLKKLFEAGKNFSSMLERPARFDSATGLRGISKRPDGYIVRATDKNGKRIYVGWWTTLEQAKKELSKWKAAKN
jgi:hypothetical protein